MIKWINEKMLPLLLQLYKVLAVSENSIKYILTVLEQLEVSTDKPVWDAVRTIQNTITVAISAIQKAVGFLGGDIPVVSSLSSSDLKTEVEKLKQML